MNSGRKVPDRFSSLWLHRPWKFVPSVNRSFHTRNRRCSSYRHFLPVAVWNGTPRPAHFSLLARNLHRLPACAASPLERLTEGIAHLLKENTMLWTIFVILLVLWLLGLVSSYTLGGFIHILLVVAIAVLLIQLITGRRAV